MKNFKYRTYWTIWAFGWRHVRSWQGRITELQIFVGPLVLTWWR